jgi:lysophospholipase L1-like esterase
MNKLFTNVLIAASSLGLSLLACEVVARQLVPAPMSIKTSVESKVPSESAAREIRGEDGSIVNVIDWSGKNGVRLYPNVNAMIRNHTLSKLDVQIRTDSLGLRGPQLGPKQPGEFRILHVGDSITFGDYMDEPETIPSLIQQQLEASGKRAVVLNAALPGANASDEFYHFLELAQSVQPDLVLVGAYLNDAQESKRFYIRTLRFPFNVSRFLTWAFQRFQLINTEELFSGSSYGDIDESWREKFKGGRPLRSGDQYGSRLGFDFEIYNAAKDFGLAWNPEAWDRLRVLYKTFSEEARKNGSQVAMHLFPVKMQVYAKSDILDTTPQQSFLSICQELNIPCYDLLPKLREAAVGIKPQDLYYDHCHFKPEGNKLVARLVSEWLMQSGTIQ